MISTRDVRFDIAAPSGGVRQQAYLDLARRDAAVEALIAVEDDAAVNQYIVADAECLRGVKAGEQFKAIPADQRDAINEQIATRAMVVEGQMARADFMAQYAPYAKALFFLQSPIKGGSAMAYRLTYDALREATVVVAKRVARSREKNVAIWADEAQGCLMLMEFSFSPAMKQPDDAVLSPGACVAVEQRQVEVARRVVEALPSASEYLLTADDATLALREELIEQALTGDGVTAPPPSARRCRWTTSWRRS